MKTFHHGFLRQKLLSPKLFEPNKIVGPKNFCPQENFGPKNVLTKIILTKTIFSWDKFWPKKFHPKEILAEDKFSPPENLRPPNNFCHVMPKNYHSPKIQPNIFFTKKNHFHPQNLFGPKYKKYWAKLVESNISQKMLLKKFWTKKNL